MKERRKMESENEITTEIKRKKKKKQTTKQRKEDKIERNVK